MLRDPSPDFLISLNGTKVRETFDNVVTGIKGAIDFLRKNLHVESLDNLPYDNLLVPLTVFFAGEPNKQKKVTNNQRKEISVGSGTPAFTGNTTASPSRACVRTLSSSPNSPKVQSQNSLILKSALPTRSFSLTPSA